VDLVAEGLVGNISPLVSATLAVDAAVENQGSGAGGFEVYEFTDEELAGDEVYA
jgi:hypothetical protein